MRISVDSRAKAALDHKTSVHRTRLRRWWHEQLDAAHAIEDPAERRQALADLRRDRQDRRDAGTWWDSQASIIACYLRADLARRGWLNRRWRRVPGDQHRLPGRRPGVGNHPPGSGEAILAVRLPADLADVLHRATWWTSATAQRALTDWHQQHPPPHDPAERAELTRLRSRITTSGNLLRHVLAATVADWYPLVGDLPEPPA